MQGGSLGKKFWGPGIWRIWSIWTDSGKKTTGESVCRITRFSNGWKSWNMGYLNAEKCPRISPMILPSYQDTFLPSLSYWRYKCHSHVCFGVGNDRTFPAGHVPVKKEETCDETKKKKKWGISVCLVRPGSDLIRVVVPFCGVNRRNLLLFTGRWTSGRWNLNFQRFQSFKWKFIAWGFSP